MTVEVAIRLSACLLGVGIFLRSLALLTLASEWRCGGAFANFPPKRDVRWGIAIRGLLALAAILGWLSPLLFAILFMVELVHHRIFRQASMAWFTMELVLVAGLGVALIDRNDEILMRICLSFIALVAVLAYWKNGMVKILSKSWRDGTFLVGLLQSSRFQVPLVGSFLARHPYLAMALSWGGILFELIFPLVLFAGDVFTLSMLSLGFVFHLGVAVVLRLHGFFWVFVATYPAIWVVGRWFTHGEFY